MNLTKKLILLLAIICICKSSSAQFTIGAGNITQSTTGNVGIGFPSYTPLSLLEVKNGSVLFDGYTGVTPVAGSGARMMWVPAKEAFRAGGVSANQWDDANIGGYSFASGISTTASGIYSFAMGATATASGNTAVSLGFNTVASGGQSNAFNYYTNATGSYTTSFGQRTTAQSYNSFVIGRFNVNPGTYSLTTWVATEPLFVIGNGIGTGANSNNAMTVLKNGNTGIGTAAPEDLFQVGTGITKVNIGSAYGANLGYGASYVGFNASRQNAAGTWTTGTDGSGGVGNNGGAIMYSDVTGGIRFVTIPSTGGTNQTGITDATINSNVKLQIEANGNVNIGTTGLPTNTYKLNVCGDIRAKKIVVTTGWCDFVFEKNYKLRTLEETERYINENGHLPEVPNAKEIETNGGDLGALVKVQMQKIEELTLYLIEQNKKIEILSKQNMLLLNNSGNK